MSKSSGALNGRYSSIGEGHVPEACKRIIYPNAEKQVASAEKPEAPILPNGLARAIAGFFFLGFMVLGVYTSGQINLVQSETGLKIQRLSEAEKAAGVSLFSRSAIAQSEALWNCGGVYTTQRPEGEVCVRMSKTVVHERSGERYIGR